MRLAELNMDEDKRLRILQDLRAAEHDARGHNRKLFVWTRYARLPSLKRILIDTGYPRKRWTRPPSYARRPGGLRLLHGHQPS